MTKNKKRLLIICIPALIFAVFYFTSNKNTPTFPASITIGVLPDVNSQKIKQNYQPFIEYLEDYVGIKFKLAIPDDYQDLVTQFRDKKVDLALFGGLTLIKSVKFNHAEALVTREIDTRFTSWFITQNDSTNTKLDDFYGKDLIFGSQLSTSGHLMPRYFLQKMFGQPVESYFNAVSFSGSHENTILKIALKKGDLGVVNSQVAQAMLKDGSVTDNQIKKIWESPPYMDYCWAVNNKLPLQLKIKLRDAFLNLSITNPKHKEILNNLNAKIFLPADIREFSRLKTIAMNLKLLNKGAE
jgi:phosphonate transport system substrate-binding protein